MSQPKRPIPNEEELYDLKNIASATECTGLIPAAYDDEDEASIPDAIKRFSNGGRGKK